MPIVEFKRCLLWRYTPRVIHIIEGVRFGRGEHDCVTAAQHRVAGDSHMDGDLPPIVLVDEDHRAR
jgi:hypothetical protein